MIDQPAPELTAESTLLCFDVESNGLHGEAFAVGAVVIKLDGTIVDEFVARCPINGPVDEWVEKNVLPPMHDFKITHKNSLELRNDFWRWFTQSKERVSYVIVDNGYPVEHRFLMQCQADDLDARYWGHAYPLLDVGSLLLSVGIKPLAVKYRLLDDQIAGEMRKHNPRFDAEVSARAAIKALRLAGRLSD
jgi:hypothetical protein